jgi:DNA-binding IclR family transcriptional regulator
MAAEDETSGAPAGRHGTVRAVSRAVAILRAFRQDRPSLGLAEIAASAQLDRGTTRRMLLTLMDEGLVRQDSVSQLYALTLRILELAAAAPTGGLREEARPVMLRLARETGATVFLSVAGTPGALCLERVDGHDPVQVKWWAVGSHMPWNCGAGPRLLLAHMPEPEARAALRHAVRLTPNSATNSRTLLAHLAEVRRRGFEVTVDDVTVGLSAVAVPVGRASAPDAALSIGGLTDRLLDATGAPRHIEVLLEASRAITANLSGGFTC